MTSFVLGCVTMLDAKNLSELVETISKALPPGLGELPDNVQQNIKASLSKWFEQMDLVSREEFDVQTQVLAKTRAKLEALEKSVEALQQKD